MSNLNRAVAVLALTLSFSLGLVAQSPIQTPAPVVRVDTVRIVIPVPGVCFLWASDEVMNDPRTGDPLIAATNPNARIPCVPVLIHRERWSNMPSPLGLFVLLHELAHIQLQHGRPAEGEVADEAFFAKREREADCQAFAWFRADWPRDVDALLSVIDPGHGANVRGCL